MTQSTPAAQARPAPARQAAGPGDLVITFYDDEPVVYGGNTERGGSILTARLLSGETPERTCDPGHVAPAGTPIPASDPRVSVAKRPRAEAPQPGYIWALTLPGLSRPTWHKTKRDATSTGLRKLAILDWHAARAAASADEPAPAGRDSTPVWNEHNNDLGDWCPWSGQQATADRREALMGPLAGDDERCPQGCRGSALESPGAGTSTQGPAG